jgi:hypothetical protein
MEPHTVSHHYSYLDSMFPHGDARLDLTDLYAFPKPGDPGKSVFIMNLHPSFGENPQGPTTAEPFAPEALYELKIDTDGDAVADIAYRLRFLRQPDGAQVATLRRAEGALAAGTDGAGRTLIEGAPVSQDREAKVTQAGDYRFFAGWRSDPFFIDRRGLFFNNLQFTGDDFFADKNVCSIVLEAPNSALGVKKVGLCHRTLIPAAGNGRWVQLERGARPLQLVLVFAATGGQPQAYLAGGPADDPRYVAGFAHALEHTGGYASNEATRVAGNAAAGNPIL